MEFPQIDIIVPTYNRQNDVNRFVIEILKQNYPHFQVCFIDDCSSPETYLPVNDPRLKLIRLNKNEGQASARNYGIKTGNGSIIVSMDDDAWFFKDEYALSKINSYFQQNQQMGCLMFDIKTPNEEWISRQYQLKNGEEIGSHITCGCAYAREALEKIKGFNGFLHSYAEETDLSLRLIANGYSIIFGKQIKVFHNYISTSRDNNWYRRLRKNTTRNDLFIVLSYYPAKWVIPYFWGKFFSHLRYSLFTGKRDRIISSLYTILGLFHVLSFFKYIVKNRKPLKNSTFKNWLKIRW